MCFGSPHRVVGFPGREGDRARPVQRVRPRRLRLPRPRRAPEDARAGVCKGQASPPAAPWWPRAVLKVPPLGSRPALAQVRATWEKNPKNTGHVLPGLNALMEHLDADGDGEVRRSVDVLQPREQPRLQNAPFANRDRYCGLARIRTRPAPPGDVAGVAGCVYILIKFNKSLVAAYTP